MLIVLFTVFSNGCLLLKIELPEDPGLKIDYFIVSETIPDQSMIEKHQKDGKVSINSNMIYSILKVSEVGKSGNIRWKWYGPDGKLIRVSPNIQINKNNSYLRYFVAWDNLNKEFFSDKPGYWSVVVFLKGKFFVKKKFNLN